MTFEALLATSSVLRTWGDLACTVKGVQYDSRKVGRGDVFVALRGAKVDGHRFITQAVSQGAVAVIAETDTAGEFRVPWAQVADGRVALGRVAALWCGNPSLDLKLAGVTGTNGKTTTAFLIQHLNVASSRQCGLLGTVRYDMGNRVVDATHTTPESLEVHQLLDEMRRNGCLAAAMEVSSHGLEQHRVEGVEYDVGVFTNLTQDHLDYHGNMESYFQAKRLLFEGLALQKVKAKAQMVVYGDDIYGKRLLSEFEGKLEAVPFGFGPLNRFRASNIRADFDGTHFQLDALGRQMLVRLPLIGNFNILNALAALGAAKAMGLNVREAVSNLQSAPQVPGRMERVGERAGGLVFVDYAHTPDAIEKACVTLRELRPERLITVFGCGGDRDRAKRPLMARAAARNSDVVFLTSDNPRTENPLAIMRDAEPGLEGCLHHSIPDRAEAIREAIELAGARDIVLIAGKGHETYQQIGTEKFPFDDRLMARRFIWEKRERS